MASQKQKDAEREEAIAELKQILKPGDTVYTVLRKVSSSGTSRHIDVYVIQNNRPRYLTGWAAKACGFRRADQGYGPLLVGGAGMDMGFHVVYSLASAVFRGSFKCTGQRSGPKRCPANDHSNDYGALSRQYDAEHDPDHTLRDSSQEAKESYVAARQQWIADQEPTLWSRKRKHSDAGYALTHEWL